MHFAYRYLCSKHIPARIHEYTLEVTTILLNELSHMSHNISH